VQTSVYDPRKHDLHHRRPSKQPLDRGPTPRPSLSARSANRHCWTLTPARLTTIATMADSTPLGWQPEQARTCHPVARGGDDMTAPSLAQGDRAVLCLARIPGSKFRLGLRCGGTQEKLVTPSSVATAAQRRRAAQCTLNAQNVRAPGKCGGEADGVGHGATKIPQSPTAPVRGAPLNDPRVTLRAATPCEDPIWVRSLSFECVL
jgi:hypothetical protein